MDPPTNNPPNPAAKTETEKPADKPKTESEKEPAKPQPSEDEQILTEVRDSYKALVSPEQWDAVKNLSIAKQIKILKTMLPAEKKADAVKADINILLNTPPAQEKRVKTFLERQTETGYANNLYNAGGFLAKMENLYKK